MGHTGIYAFGDCVRRIGLGRFATVVELRIPCVYAWGVSIVRKQLTIKRQSFLKNLSQISINISSVDGAIGLRKREPESHRFLNLVKSVDFNLVEI